MDQLINFIVNHWFLCSLFAVMLVIFLINEIQHRSQGIKRLSPQQVVDLMNHEHAVIVDIRAPEAFEKGHILGALNIQLNDFNIKKSKLKNSKSKPIVIVCGQGLDATKFGKVLKQAGFMQVFQLNGGIALWQQELFPVSKAG